MSVGTAAFLAAWSAHNTRRVALAKIVFSVPSALTIRYATTECHTPDGSLWQMGLSGQPIRQQMPYLSPGVAPAEASIRLAKRRDASQSSGTIHDLLSDYLFQNATVTIYRWVDEPLGSVTLTFADALQVFKGVVSRTDEVDPEGVTLHLLQDMSWNKQTPPTVVDKVSYPDSPDVSQGLPIPIIYGDHRAPAMRSPWAAGYTNKSKQEDSGAGVGVVPLVVVDAGVGGASVKAVAAGHLLADLIDRTAGMSPFMNGGDVLAPLETAGGVVTETLGASESYLTIADESVFAYVAAIPIDVRASENTATNPRRAMDPFDETSYATVDQNTSDGELQLILPNMPGLGRIESVQYYVAWSGNAGNANNLRIRSRTPTVGFGTTSANWVATNPALAVQIGTWATADYYQGTEPTWDFGGGATIRDVRIDFTGGATNQARIYWVVLVIKFRPNRSIVTPGKYVYKPPVGRRAPGDSYRDPVFQHRPRNFIEPSLQLDSQFYANLKGYLDDGSGTYTGSASALIERPPDIARHFLVTYGAVSGGSIETDASDVGSFVLARSTLRNAQPSDLELACWIGERTSVQRVLQAIAEQSGMCIYLDRFTDQWLCFVWKPGAVEDYGYKLSWYELAQFGAEETSVVDVRHAIRVKYGYDHFKSKTLYEAFVSASGSGQGLNLPTTRDQRLVVDATNEDLDWTRKIGAGATVTYAATLAHATYARPIDLAVDIRAKMRAAEGDSFAYAGHGFSIKAGWNDLFDFIVAGVNYQATLNDGDYTAEGLAAEAARAMTAVPLHLLTFTASYSHSTNKFTITGSANWMPDGFVAGPGRFQSATALGLTGSAPGVVPALSFTGGACYGDRFFIGNGDGASAVGIKWGTGASASTNCALLLGWERTDVTGAVLAPRFDATYSRGTREATASTYQGYYGPREERQITASWIRDEGTAVSLRDRLFDLAARPRVVARFSTFRAPDVRVMQVLEFQSDLDVKVAYPKYGSDGSWVGKPMRVLEVTSHLGPSHHDEILAIEA